MSSANVLILQISQPTVYTEILQPNVSMGQNLERTTLTHRLPSASLKATVKGLPAKHHQLQKLDLKTFCFVGACTLVPQSPRVSNMFGQPKSLALVCGALTEATCMGAAGSGSVLRPILYTFDCEHAANQQKELDLLSYLFHAEIMLVPP